MVVPFGALWAAVSSVAGPSCWAVGVGVVAVDIRSFLFGLIFIKKARTRLTDKISKSRKAHFILQIISYCHKKFH